MVCIDYSKYSMSEVSLWHIGVIPPVTPWQKSSISYQSVSINQQRVQSSTLATTSITTVTVRQHPDVCLMRQCVRVIVGVLINWSFFAPISQPAIDFFSNEVMIHPVTNRPEDKRSFIPSLIEKEKARAPPHFSFMSLCVSSPSLRSKWIFLFTAFNTAELGWEESYFDRLDS